MISFSIVVPVYSGETYLTDLMSEIDKVKTGLETDGSNLQLAEVIFVEDGAIDGSSALIDDLAGQYQYVAALHLSRNFGQHPATVAGILHSSGDWVVTMDEDLQHPPARITDLFNVVAEVGADIVYGKPRGGTHQSAIRDLSSRLYKRLIETLTGNHNIAKVSSFRLVRGPVARAASAICGHDTYFDVALGWFTQRVESTEMDLWDLRYIHSGKSRYSFRSLVSHARRLAFSSQIKLLRFGALLGIAILVLTVLAALVLLPLWAFWPAVSEVRGWTSLVLIICFFSGAILFLLGVLLEYVSILVLRAHGKPLFFVTDRSNDHLLRKATDIPADDAGD